MSRWVEIAPGVHRLWREPQKPVARSTLPTPYVISDEMPPVEHVDGRFYTSKRGFRDVTRANGFIEIGNEKQKPKVKASSLTQTRSERRAQIKTAVEKYKAGHRPGGKRL